MGGTAFVLVLLIVGVLAITLVSVLVPSVTIDYDSPLNMVMFRSPGANRYTDQLVNYWVQKTWRSDSGRIPCRLEKGYAEAVPLADRRLIIYSHGNAEDMLLCAEFLRSVSESLHMDIMTWDYSGYGARSVVACADQTRLRCTGTASIRSTSLNAPPRA